MPAFAHKIPRARWAHSSDVMDYAMLADKRVGVVGAGASAMDSAATALEAGAASVDLLIRRDDIPRINKGKGAGNPGLTHGHLNLPDDWKWKIRHYINAAQVPPPRGSTLRVSRHPNARFNLGCGVRDLALIDDEIRVTTPKGEFALDFLIFSTGFRIDWTARPEFAALARTCAPGATATRPPPATRTRNCMTPRPGPRLRAAGKIARRLSRAGPRALLLVPGRADTRHGVGRHPRHQRGREAPGPRHRRAVLPRGRGRALRQHGSVLRAGSVRRRMDARATALGRIRAAGNGGSAHASPHAYSASHRRHGDRQMTGWLLRRIAQAAVVVFLMTLIVFVGLHAIGNPVDILIGQDVDQVDRARIIAELGLDKPLWQQYLGFLNGALHGNLGNSFVYNIPAVELVIQRLPATFELAIAAMLLAVLIGLPLGLLAGLYPDSRYSKLIMAGSIVGFSLPTFWIALMLIMTFSVSLGWLPASGRGQRWSCWASNGPG